jgi:hypothetical protein
MEDATEKEDTKPLHPQVLRIPLKSTIESKPSAEEELRTRTSPPKNFFCGATARSGPQPPHYRGFTITLRHTTLGRTPLDE